MFTSHEVLKPRDITHFERNSDSQIRICKKNQNTSILDLPICCEHVNVYEHVYLWACVCVSMCMCEHVYVWACIGYMRACIYESMYIFSKHYMSIQCLHYLYCIVSETMSVQRIFSLIIYSFDTWHMTSVFWLREKTLIRCKEYYCCWQTCRLYTDTLRIIT